MEAQSKQTSALLSKLGGLRVASPARGSARSTVPYDEIVTNLDSPLPHWDRVKEGVLSNGMRYYIQPNTTPPNTFDAYLRVHVGSLAEEEDQQGIAHYVEHLVFMGTEAYPDAESMRKLFATWGMSFGGDTNAYTDFRSTVYTFHAPTHTQSQGDGEKKEDDEQNNVFKVLFALHQLAFKALFPTEAVDSERGPILSEAQISNSIGYRVEYQEYQQIHADNLLSKRFPIGLVEQIKKWNREDLLRFYRKWYRPDLMTLYIVGDVDQAQVQGHIENLFGKEVRDGDTPHIPEATPTFEPPRERLSIFQHELLHQFSLTINHLFPLTNQRTVRDLRTEMICYILMSTLEARVYALEQTYESPVFTSIEWNFFNSHSDNCSVSSMCMFARPTTWKEAIKCGVQEMVRMAKYGVTSHEFERYMEALIKEAHQDAEQQDSLKSSDLIEDLVDDSLVESVLVSPKDDYELVVRLAPTISLAEVNHLARQTFSQTLRVADILRGDDAKLAEAEADENGGGGGGGEAESYASSLAIIEKSRGLSVFVTCPSLYSPDEEAPAAKGAKQKKKKKKGVEDDGSEEDGEAMDEDDGEEDEDEDEDEDEEDDGDDDGEDDEEEEEEEESTPEECQAKHQHKFIHSRTAQLIEKEVKETQKSEKDGQPQRKKLPFRVTKEEIRQVIDESMTGVEAPKDIEVPQDLITEEAIQRKAEQCKPAWVPVTCDPTRQDALAELQARIDSAREESAGGDAEPTRMETEEKSAEPEGEEDGDMDEEGDSEDGDEDEDEEDDDEDDGDDDDDEEEEEEDGRVGGRRADETSEEARRKRRKADTGPTTPRLIHKPSGIVLLELSNGIRVNYLYSSYYQKRCSIRITSVGGQLCEQDRQDAGLTQLALDTTQQSGAGPHSSEVVVAWCGRWGVEASAEATLETTCLHVNTSLSHDGLRKALQLVHLLLSEPRWDERAWKRIRTHAASCREGEEKEIDSIAADNLSSILYQPTDWRFSQPSAADLRNASSERARALLSHQLLDTRNLEVSLVGHFECLQDVEDLLLAYLGTIPRRSTFAPVAVGPVDTSSSPSSSLTGEPALNPFSANLDLPAVLPENAVLALARGFPSRIGFTDEPRLKWQHLAEDEERRAIVYLCFPAMNRWGHTKFPADEQARLSQTTTMTTTTEGPDAAAAAIRQRVSRHPLWKSRVANLLVEILSNRLFSVVRERKGLLYSVSASLRMPDLYDSGTLHVTLTPFPDSIALTIEEALRVLYDFKHGNITQQELDEAKVPYLEWLITAMKGPAFWMSIMEYLQLPQGVWPQETMDLSCAELIYEAYAAIELADVRGLVPEFFQGMRVMCASIGTSGTEPPQGLEEQRQRVQRAIDSFPVPPSTSTPQPAQPTATGPSS